MSEKARGPPPGPLTRSEVYANDEREEKHDGGLRNGQRHRQPCPFPATVALPDRFDGDEPYLCAYHAATEPLVEESNEYGVSLELVRAYLKGARRHGAAGPLVEVLERVEADFAGRYALAEKVLDDLRAAELRNMRG